MGVNAVFLHGVQHLADRQRAFIRQRLERRDRDVIAVHLEMPAQFNAGVAAAKTVRTQGQIAASRQERAQLLGVEFQ